MEIADGQLEAQVEIEFEPGFRVSGIVLRAEQPVAGKRVSLSGPGSANARSSSEGTFELADVAPGEYELRVSERGRVLTRTKSPLLLSNQARA